MVAWEYCGRSNGYDVPCSPAGGYLQIPTGVLSNEQVLRMDQSTDPWSATYYPLMDMPRNSFLFPHHGKRRYVKFKRLVHPRALLANPPHFILFLALTRPPSFPILFTMPDNHRPKRSKREHHAPKHSYETLHRDFFQPTASAQTLISAVPTSPGGVAATSGSNLATIHPVQPTTQNGSFTDPSPSRYVVQAVAYT